MKNRLLLLSIVCSVPAWLSAHPNLIKSYRIVNKNKIVVKANKRFSKKFIKEDFFAEYDESIDLTKLDESIVTIPFILSIIPVVWVGNQNYSIDVMDKDLYYSLQEIKKIFRIFYPQQKWVGKLIPKQLVTNRMSLSYESGKPTLAALFSGGLDCVDSSISHSETKQLLITAWGSDVPLYKTDMWSCVHKKCQQFAHTYGHEYMFVKSNFLEIMTGEERETQKNLMNKLRNYEGWWASSSLGLSYTGLTAPILVARNIPTLLIASSYTLEYPYPFGSHPAIDNAITFAGRTVYHDGAERDRVQKIMNIATICEKKDIPFPCLRVCWAKEPNGGNCLKCDKCVRTVFNVIAAGQEPKKFAFNIEVSEAIQVLKRFFKEQKYLKNYSIMFWQNNWLYLNALSEQIKTNLALSDQDVETLRNFLYSIDLERYRNPRARIYSPQEHELFATIWKQNVKEVKI